MLGQAGGERRLNVAVTRARKKVVLMTSMPVELISEMHSHRGPPARPRDYLQAYMEYAHTVSDGVADSGRALLGRLVTDRAAERDAGGTERDGFSDAVEEFLRAQGWQPADANDGGASVSTSRSKIRALASTRSESNATRRATAFSKRHARAKCGGPACCAMRCPTSTASRPMHGCTQGMASVRA